jgi:WD40-like Beta Propeller Repeat
MKTGGIMQMPDATYVGAFSGLGIFALGVLGLQHMQARVQMRTRFLVVLLLMEVASFRAFSWQHKEFFAEPQSVLLFSGQSATDFLVVTPTGNHTIPSPAGSIPEISTPLPALAPAGDQVASSFSFPVDFAFVPCSKPGCAQPRGAKYKSVMGVYSMRDKAWKLYGDFCFAGSAAFSPDGKRVAFLTKTRADNPNCHAGAGSSALQILDLETGQFTPVPDSGTMPGNGQLSWAPDGRQLAVGLKGQIVLIEIGSWAQRAITVGTNPSWSPRGDWIAYLADSNETCMLIRPDGTGAKILLDLRRRSGGWAFRNGETWSPDGDKLLLSAGEMDALGYEVTMMSLASGEVTTNSKKGALVLGWAADRLLGRY